MPLTNEFGQMEQAIVGRVQVTLGSPVVTPAVFRTIAAVPEELADSFAGAFPACLIAFLGARVLQRSAVQGSSFASRVEGSYAALTYANSGKSEDQSRYGLLGIYELEKLVRTSLMGWAPGLAADLSPSPLFLTSVDPVAIVAGKGGSGLLKMRTVFTIDQLITATAT